MKRDDETYDELLARLARETDTSVVIDYLEGREPVVGFVEEEEQLLTSTICIYEVLEGEVFGPGQTDMVATRRSCSKRGIRSRRGT
jgi:predicted nucleic acid-binding protein